MCIDVHILEKLNSLPENIFELSCYQDQNKRKHKLFLLKLVKRIQIELLTFYSMKISVFLLKNFMYFQINMILNLFVDSV